MITMRLSESELDEAFTQWYVSTHKAAHTTSLLRRRQLGHASCPPLTSRTSGSCSIARPAAAAAATATATHIATATPKQPLPCLAPGHETYKKEPRIDPNIQARIIFPCTYTFTFGIHDVCQCRLQRTVDPDAHELSFRNLSQAI